MLRSLFYFWLGLAILLANKLRYALQGYTTPRPFDVADIERVCAYDETVVTQWEKQLQQYTEATEVLRDKRVLELGPGSDIGNAFILLAHGAQRYTSLDINNLLTHTPDQLYTTLLERLGHPELIEELKKYQAGQTGRIQTVVDGNFSLQGLPAQSVDVMVSQAAFEHFDDVERVITELSGVVSGNALLCAEIDLQTHTGVVRERDPLNIYRLPNWLYRALHFSGIPNRVRPYQYVEYLKKTGWEDIRVVSVTTIRPNNLPKYTRGLAAQFRDSKNQMEVLHFVLLAKHSG